jgi:hypothetical protein
MRHAVAKLRSLQRCHPHVPRTAVAAGAAAAAFSAAVTCEAPDGWQQARDPASGKSYWYNRSTGESSWEPPVMVPTGPAATPPPVGGGRPEIDAAATSSTSGSAGTAGTAESTSTTSTTSTAPVETKAATAVGSTESPSSSISTASAETEAAAAAAVSPAKEQKAPLSQPDRSSQQGWEEVTDPSSGQTYLFNRSTGETKWKKSTTLSQTDLLDKAQRLRYRAEQPSGTLEPLVEIWSSTQARDADGEAVLKDLVESLRASGSKFVDTHFPADDTSLYRQVPNPNRDPAGLPYRARFRGTQWKRPAEFAPGRNPVVFSDGASPDDISQGKLGDCYFLAALAACASAKDEVFSVRDLLFDGHDVGLYAAKFFVNGSWVTVIVDDLFPCHRDLSGKFRPVFARSCENTGSTGGGMLSPPEDGYEEELWVMIMEKAWAKLHGSFEAIEAGNPADALNYLSGGCVSNLTFACNDKEEHENAWQRLCALFDDTHRPKFTTAGVRKYYEAQKLIAMKSPFDFPRRMIPDRSN